MRKIFEDYFSEYQADMVSVCLEYVDHRGECIIVCVKAKFVDTVRAHSGHPIGGFIPTWQNAK